MSVFRPGLFKDKVANVTGIDHSIVTGIIHLTMKTRTKIVHENVSQGCN